ncbi:unnamed protein product [[Candida] boidinii]|uniref:Peroxin-7 n=1 Tax=Candida boidinii TaxID=5477 RepID=A0A9W6SWL3_CANBO|nr:unnamed protein product [[Candida] boidinii]GMF99611.1 unnamed protein product [[Candida] boidinii]
MLSFRTTGYNGYACKYSPFYDNKIAVATSANYGLVGNGKLFILSINEDGSISEDAAFDTQDGLFDLSWSEAHENQIVTSSGDGTISLFDTTLPKFPIKKYAGHTREVFSVHWNLVDKSTFCTSSWDGTIGIWSPNRDDPLMRLIPPPSKTETRVEPVQNPNSVPLSSNKPIVPNPQNDCIYQAVFSPHDPSLLISCNRASHIQAWDIRSPQPLQLDFIAHGGLEALTCDFNKYRSSVIASAGVDKSIKIWDLRMIQSLSQPPPSAALGSPHHNVGPTPLNKLIGHDFAVRKISWSPHSGDMLLSASYDMTSRVWHDQTDHKARFLNNRFAHGQACKNIFHGHKEFVIGCDWSLWGDPGWVVTTGWDEMVYVWDSKRKY